MAFVCVIWLFCNPFCCSYFVILSTFLTSEISYVFCAALHVLFCCTYFFLCKSFGFLFTWSFLLCWFLEICCVVLLLMVLLCYSVLLYLTSCVILFTFVIFFFTLTLSLHVLIWLCFVKNISYSAKTETFLRVYYPLVVCLTLLTRSFFESKHKVYIQYGC